MSGSSYRMMDNPLALVASSKCFKSALNVSTDGKWERLLGDLVKAKNPIYTRKMTKPSLFKALRSDFLNSLVLMSRNTAFISSLLISYGNALWSLRSFVISAKFKVECFSFNYSKLLTCLVLKQVLAYLLKRYFHSLWYLFMKYSMDSRSLSSSKSKSNN